MFSFMSLNARGKPLESREVIINLIAATTTNTGLKIYAQLDERDYPKGIEVSDQQLAAVSITRHAFHGEWNYHIKPISHKVVSPNELEALYKAQYGASPSLNQ